MNLGSENRVTISEASQNFYKVARLVDEKGTAIILEDDIPRYVVVDYGLFRQSDDADDSDMDAAASRILAKHIRAFEALAK